MCADRMLDTCERRTPSPRLLVLFVLTQTTSSHRRNPISPRPAAHALRQLPGGARTSCIPLDDCDRAVLSSLFRCSQERQIVPCYKSQSSTPERHRGGGVA
ncbi:hypothetical protein DAEQUDRAFT_729010 [Daedalea quercina L-15889]|uniref:Uncharacterized protein n=1 Tax=Daedalea quercina L-15889 TaxID=1314783 RepID=A0A165NZL3_9APHY|nr:hypothetical protein DAEQUDRAFT_729010 [Daedalea quercina L-15889]